MTARFATDDEITSWNDLLRQNPNGGNLFQMSESAAVKATSGWTPRYIMAGSTAVLALERSMPLLGKFWYLPKGPSVDSVDNLQDALTAITPLGRSHGVFTIKIEPELPKDSPVSGLGLVRSFPVQPNASTVLIDLSPSLDDILAAFNQKGRHAVRRAERDGVTARPVDPTPENLATMYALMRQTAEGQWNLRPKEYLTNYWQTFTKNGHGQLFFAYYEGEVVAASFGVRIGANGTYKDGASIRKRTAYGASHLLQWEMMKWMKSHGVTHYDLCGAPPKDRIDDMTHPLYGVGRFKTSFNKSVTEYVGAYELPLSKWRFKLWKTVVERLALRLSVKLRHQEWY